MNHNKNQRGFTLVELLIVIGIITILSTVLVLVLNPLQFFRQARDSERVSEINAINSALSLYLSLGQKFFGEPNTVYISLPDTSATCENYKLPVLTVGWEYHCASPSSFRNVDGTGWIPVDLTKSVSITGPLFSALPIDPVNQFNNSLYYTYVYDGNKWALSVPAESKKFEIVAAVDQGPIATRYEVGTSVELNKGKVEGKELTVVNEPVLPSQQQPTAPIVSQSQTGGFEIVWDFLKGLYLSFKKIIIALFVYGFLLFATAFSWLAFCMETVDWIKGIIKKESGLRNPFLSVRFYKAIFYSIAFVLSIYFLRSQVAP